MPAACTATAVPAKGLRDTVLADASAPSSEWPEKAEQTGVPDGLEVPLILRCCVHDIVSCARPTWQCCKGPGGSKLAASLINVGLKARPRRDTADWNLRKI